MGTTVSSLQILGATEDAVKVAMPKAIVGKWSERYVTACLYGFAFGALERKAGWLSKKLDCTVFSVSLFDGDMLSLALYTCGKRTARHVVNPETGEVVLGNVAAFCTGLKVRKTLAPDLKRLFSTSNQDMYLKAFGSDGIGLHSLDLNGQMLASIPSYGTQLMASGNYLYQLEAQGYRKDDTLHRFTSDLEDAGCLQVPYMSDMAISSDGSSLLCAGYSSGLAVIDLDEFKMRRAVHSRDNVCAAMADGKNRFWVGNNGYIECYSPDLELLSRHRLAGEIMDSSLNPAGELCLATYQRKNYLTRVYRLY